MRAIAYEAFQAKPRVVELPDPVPPADGAVVRVRATGLCRSDWHGWMGHDPMIQLPHVPGHEFAGEVAAVGSQVRAWREGDRVTSPFVNGCGTCRVCRSGNSQVCPDQHQPGFTHWGSFAEYVVVRHADHNLVRLPPKMDFAIAASLGCRFATAYRGLVNQAQVRPGQWVVVLGCGGVGLSAVMIARAAGARIVAVDINDAPLKLAQDFGAELTLNATTVAAWVNTVREVTEGGADVSIDALGHPDTCLNAVRCLGRGGTHLQLGLLLGAHRSPPIPMDLVIAHELRIVGSHGMAAQAYSPMMDLVAAGRLEPGRLVQDRVELTEGAERLTEMGNSGRPGVTIIDRF